MGQVYLEEGRYIYTLLTCGSQQAGRRNMNQQLGRNLVIRICQLSMNKCLGSTVESIQEFTLTYTCRDWGAVLLQKPAFGLLFCIYMYAQVCCYICKYVSMYVE